MTYAPTNQRDDDSDGRATESHLFDYLYVLVKRRRLILSSIIATGVVTAIVVLLLPNWYAATASVLPPKRPGGLLSMLEGGVSSLIKNIPGLGRIGSSQESYSYLAILQSRTVMEKVVTKFNLVEVYDVPRKSVEEALKELSKNAEFDIASEGNITITVYDTSPQRAADMANYFVELLNELSVQLGTQEARNNREFIERRYQQNLHDLARAEDSLKAFQQRYGIYALPEQTESAIKAISELKSEAVAKEIEAAIARRALGEENPKTRMLELELAELNRKLLEMKYGSPDWYKDQSLRLFVPFKDVPELATIYLRLYREFEIQNRLLEFLLPLYEQAKIEERKNTPVVLVLDRAVPPERKKKPFRSLIVFVAVALAAILSTTGAFLAEIYDREKQRNWRVAAIREQLQSGYLYRKFFRPRTKSYFSTSEEERTRS